MAGKTTEQKGTGIRVSPDLARKIKVIKAARPEMNMPEILEKYGGPGIDREFRKVQNEMHELGGEG